MIFFLIVNRESHYTQLPTGRGSSSSCLFPSKPHFKLDNIVYHHDRPSVHSIMVGSNPSGRTMSFSGFLTK
jgi:hypothetical protein